MEARDRGEGMAVEFQFSQGWPRVQRGGVVVWSLEGSRLQTWLPTQSRAPRNLFMVKSLGSIPK